MSHLKALKLTSAKPVAAQSDPIQGARDKVMEALAEQKAMAEAKLAGQHCQPTHKVWRKNETGRLAPLARRKLTQSGLSMAQGFEEVCGQIVHLPARERQHATATTSQPVVADQVCGLYFSGTRSNTAPPARS